MEKFRTYQAQTKTVDNFWDELGLPSGGELLSLVHSGFPFVVVERLSRLSGFIPLELAALIQISPSTLRRRRLAGRFTESESDRVHRVATVLGAARTLFEGDLSVMKHWMTTPQFGLGGRRPADLLATSVGSEAVLTLVGRLEHGVLA